MTIQEQIVTEILAYADLLESELVEPTESDGGPLDPPSFLPTLEATLGPKIAGLREAARIARNAKAVRPNQGLADQVRVGNRDPWS